MTIDYGAVAECHIATMPTMLTSAPEAWRLEACVNPSLAGRLNWNWRRSFR